jgi:prevent-host-death family protein
MKIAVTEFKAKCLKLIDEIARVRDPIILTKHGKPVAKLIPIEEQTDHLSQFGYMAGSATITGDIESAITEPWASDQDQLFKGVTTAPDHSDKAKSP